jgi:hypothetical protein
MVALVVQNQVVLPVLWEVVVLASDPFIAPHIHQINTWRTVEEVKALVARHKTQWQPLIHFVLP